MRGVVEYSKMLLIGFVSWAVSYFQPLGGVIVLFLVLFGVDFVTGLLASFSRGQHFRSWKARDSFFKLLVYLSCFAFILAIGREVSKLDCDPEHYGDFASIVTVLKTVIYIAIWFEAKSNAENLHIIFPRNRFVQFMDYLLGVEFVKKLPWLRDFLDRDNKDGIDRTKTDK